MTQRTRHDPTLCYMRHLQIVDNIDSFPKNILNVFRIKKKANCIFGELSNLYLIVLLISFFSLFLWITAENRTKLKKLFIWTTKSGGAQHQTHTKCTWLFMSNYNNASDILDWAWFLHYFWLQLNSFTNKLKNLWSSKKFL